MPDVSVLLQYAIEQGIFALFALYFYWRNSKIEDKNSTLQDQVIALQKEASAHVERLYQARIEAESRLNTTVNEISRIMETVVETVEEGSKSSAMTNEAIRQLQQISATNQEIGRDIKNLMSARRDQ